MSKSKGKSKQKVQGKRTPKQRSVPSKQLPQLKSDADWDDYYRRYLRLDEIVLSDESPVAWGDFNQTVRAAIDYDAASYAAVVDTYLRERGWPDGSDDIAFVCEHVRFAVELGFRMALSRYREHLENVPELQRRKATAAASSHVANKGKRKARVVVGNRSMTRDQRDAEMVAEYERLLQLPMKHTPACQRLAEHYEYESWQGVANAIKQFRQRAAR